MKRDFRDGSGAMYPDFSRGSGIGAWRRGGGRAVVLEAIRTGGPVSRAEIARVSGISMPTVMEIVDRLVSGALIRESGRGPSTGGRRPMLLELVPGAGRAVGVEVGARTMTAVVADLAGTVEVHRESPSDMESGSAALTRSFRGLLGEVLEEAGGGLLGIGLSFPAPLLSSRGMVFSPPSYPGWGEMSPEEVIGDAHGLPVVIDNDANAAAVGEYLFGAGRGAKSMFYVALNRGVGGALVIDGELHRGAVGGAGEIGHTLIDLAGPRCGCGNHGCLEAFAGRKAIAERAARAMPPENGADRIHTHEVIEAALAGDEVALGVISETGRYVGVGLSNVVNMFDPEVLIVGGSTMAAGRLLLDPAIQVARERAVPGMADHVSIVAGDLGEDAGPVGAASLVLRETLTMGGVMKGGP